MWQAPVRGFCQGEENAVLPWAPGGCGRDGVGVGLGWDGAGGGMGLGWDGAGGGFHTENAHLEPKNQKDAGKL